MNLLYRRGGMQRSEISLELELTGAGVSRITRELIDAGLICEGQPRAQKGVIGRRSSKLTINPDGAFVLALTITANKKSVALFNASRENLDQVELKELDYGKPEETVNGLLIAAEKLLQRTDIEPVRLAGIGVGVAMQSTDSTKSMASITSGVLGWKDVRLAEMIQHAFPYPLAIEARAPALLRAEINLLNPKDTNNLFLINVGLGIGTAAYFDGEVLSGSKFGFGSVLHIPHPQSDVQCECGRQGCLEHSASGQAVVLNWIGQQLRTPRNFDELSPLLSKALQEASSGNKAAKEALFEAGRKMATGVDTVQSMLDPDRIMLAGETGRQQDYIEGLKHGLKELHSPLKDHQLTISNATSAEASAAIALDAFVYSEQLNVERLSVA